MMSGIPRQKRVASAILLGSALLISAARGQPAADSPMMAIAGAPSIAWVATGDLNGDGKVDLALAEAKFVRNPAREQNVFRLHLLFQKAGAFAMPADKVIDLPGPASGLAVGDFDKDGKADLAVGLRSMRSLAVYLGGENFEKQHLSQYGNDSGAGGLSLGRISRDAPADFMTGAAWRRWNKGGRFSEGYFCGPERNDNWHSTLADLDRDGTDDVIFTTFWTTKPAPKGSNNFVRIYYGPFLSVGLVGPTSGGGLITLTSPLADAESEALGQVLVGDLNGDEQPDLVVPARDKTLIYFQNNPTGFTDRAGPSLVLDGVTALLAEDLDGDRLCDIVFRAADGKSVAIWRQGKQKPLTANWAAESRKVSLAKRAVAAAAGDLSRDGNKMLFVALEGGGLALVPSSQP
jgi:hypothetical protein